MLFSSTEFLFFFLPGVIFCYYVLCRKSRLMQNILLLISSLLFMLGGTKVCGGDGALHTAELVFRPDGGKVSDKKGILRFWLVAATVFNLGLLFIFKYLMFTLNNVNAVFGLNINVPVINLPIGISFHIQAFSYVLDISGGVCEAQKIPCMRGFMYLFFLNLLQAPLSVMKQ